MIEQGATAPEILKYFKSSEGAQMGYKALETNDREVSDAAEAAASQNKVREDTLDLAHSRPDGNIDGITGLWGGDSYDTAEELQNKAAGMRSMGIVQNVNALEGQGHGVLAAVKGASAGVSAQAEAVEAAGMLTLIEDQYAVDVEQLETNKMALEVSNALGVEDTKKFKEGMAAADKRKTDTIKALKNSLSGNADQIIAKREDDITRGMIKAQKSSQFDALMTHLGVAEEDRAKYEGKDGLELMKAIRSNNPDLGAEGEAEILKIAPAAFARVADRKANDFIYRSTGEIQYFDSADDIIGGKMGGAFEQMSRGMSAGLPGGSKSGAPGKASQAATSLSFVIQETENPEATARAVRKILTEVGLV